MGSNGIEDFLRRCRRLTGEELERALPPADENPPALHRAMRYAVFGGGKRLRPAVCMASAQCAGSAPAAARRPAAALELLHAYTLIHDDLPCMDDDTMRRGRPTVHVEFGEATAVLAGDALLTLAFAWLAGPETANDVTAGWVRELAAAAGSRGIVGGQADDLAGEGQAAQWTVVAAIHARKTAALFRAAAVMGGIAAGASQAQLQALADYGFELGMAFQVADDLLNVTATEADLGKPVGSDQAREKLTAVAALGETGARDEARRRAAAAVAAAETFSNSPASDLLTALAHLSIARKS